MQKLSKLEPILAALALGADIYCSVSGGKDGQAMAKALQVNEIPVKGMIHCDLGEVEWKASHEWCERSATELGVPLHTLRRRDGRTMLQMWRDRMIKLAGTGKPFWSSSKARYCTSDMKRLPANFFLRNCGNNLIISAEGIRAGESTARGKKDPLTIRWEITSTYYKDMTVEQAIANYNPNKRLALTWFPVFDFTLNDVWGTYDMDNNMLELARRIYREENVVAEWWPFHPAYAYGNDRVSCVICVLGSKTDILNGVKHNPEVFQEMLAMEQESGFAFRMDLSLASCA